MSEGVAVGESVPDVTQTLVEPDGETAAASLSDLVSERPALVCFYTMDFAPNCVEEWCAFRDYGWFASDDRVRVVGASRSGPRLHRQFIDRLGLGFPLYADTDLALAEAFDVDYRAFGLFRRSRRSCFLLDPELTVRYRWVGDHWLDPTRDVPPVAEIRDGVDEVLGGPETETFGFS
ncbi:MAG: peroxiredoxin family protein [Halobacteriaceae archaeon]